VISLQLYILCDKRPPKKNEWEIIPKENRKVWSEIYQLVCNWFCLSNGFRSDNALYCYILLDHNDIIEITFDGKYLRYLSPQMRSAASLISKAYYNKKLIGTEILHSTPGITIKTFNSILFENELENQDFIELITIKNTKDNIEKPLFNGNSNFLVNFTDEINFSKKYSLKQVKLPFNLIDTILLILNGEKK
jgi:tRNA pseudouridine-54 N-methylase